MRLGHADRTIVEMRHFRRIEIDELQVPREERADRLESVDRPLVECDEIFAARLDRITVRGGEVPGIVLQRQLVDHLPAGAVRISDLPLRNGTVEVEARVTVAVTVKLRMKRSETDRYLCDTSGAERDHRDAVRVVFETAAFDSCLNALEAENLHVRVELAADGDVFTVRADVDAVRAFWFGRQE